MRFLIDEDMPRSTARLLKEKGYEAIDVRDVGLRGAPDKDILAYAREKQAAVITADVGFAGFSFLASVDHYGLILVRVPNEFTISQINELLLASLQVLGGRNIAGSVAVIEPNKIRIRAKKSADR